MQVQDILQKYGPILAGSEELDLIIAYKNEELHALQGNCMGNYTYLVWCPCKPDLSLPALVKYADDFLELLNMELKQKEPDGDF